MTKRTKMMGQGEGSLGGGDAELAVWGYLSKLCTCVLLIKRKTEN